MKSYYKFAPVLMLLGFVLIAGGVFMSMAENKEMSFVFAGLGLVSYIAGRVGMFYASKSRREQSVEKEKEEEFEIEPAESTKEN